MIPWCQSANCQTIRKTLPVVVLLGLLAGFVWGYVRAPSGTVEQRETHAGPHLVMPKLASELAPKYRAALEKTGSLVSSALRAYPENVNTVIALARLNRLAHIRTGEIKCWQRCLELAPGNRVAYSRLIQLAEQDGDFERVVGLMRTALALSPDDTGFQRQLAKALIYQRQGAEARYVLESQLHKGQADGETYLILGQACDQLDQFQQARRFLEAATVLLPRRSDVYYTLAKVYTKLDMKEEASRCADQFEKIKQRQRQQGSQMIMPDDVRDELVLPRKLAEIIILVGQAYAENDATERAIQCFIRAAEVCPEDIRSRELLSAHFHRTGQLDQAIRWVRELRNTDPDNLTHLRNEGILYAEMGESVKAERAFKDLIRRAPSEALGYAPLAELYLSEHRDLARAKFLAQTAMDLEPSPPHVALLVAIARATGDFTAARKAIGRALESDPGNREYKKAYASLVPR